MEIYRSDESGNFLGQVKSLIEQHKALSANATEETKCLLVGPYYAADAPALSNTVRSLVQQRRMLEDLVNEMLERLGRDLTTSSVFNDLNAVSGWREKFQRSKQDPGQLTSV